MQPHQKSEPKVLLPILNDLDYSLPEIAPGAEIIDKYVFSIIGSFASQYHGLEIHGVRDHNKGNDAEETCVEVDNLRPQFFSVYARNMVCGGIDCIGDFSFHSHAKEYALEVAAQYSWPVNDHVMDRFRKSPPTEQLQ